MARARRLRTYIEGIEECAEMLRDMEDLAVEILDEAAHEGSKIVLESAKQKCGVFRKTGALQNSLDIKAEKSKLNTKRYWRLYSKGVSQGGVRYAFAVEGGTKKMEARPFMRQAIDENKEAVKKKVAEVIVKKLEEIQ